MNIEELVTKAEKFNKEEIQKYNPDMEFLYNISYNARYTKYRGEKKAFFRLLGRFGPVGLVWPSDLVPNLV